MKYDIDCLIIGNNETDFGDYVGQVEMMGLDSGSFQDLFPNYIYHENKPYNAKQIYNLFSNEQVDMSEVFSATIAYLATFLNKHNLTYDYVMTFQDGKEDLIDKLKNKKIATIAITTTLYVSVFPIIEIMNLVKEYCSDTKIIVGGPFVTTQCKVLDRMSLQYLLKSINADFYINSSQGELALTNIIKAVINNTNYDEIDNIYYKNGNEYLFTRNIEENNLLSENLVKWDLFDEIGGYVNLRTSISCPFSCSFCAFPEHAGKYQVISVADIEKELDAIEAKGTVKSIFFVDDTLNVPGERFKELLKLMIRKQYSFHWYSHYRCQFADEETVKLMKESGCEGVFLGIESGSDSILTNMNKRATKEMFKKGIELLKENDIMIQASYIIGFPGETEETIQETIDFINSTEVDFYRVQLWYCDTTTRIYKEGKKKFGIQGSQFEWKHNTMDCKTAINHLKSMTLNLKNHIRIPNYFDIDAVIRLKHSNVSKEKILEFLNIFNDCVKDKIYFGEKENISKERINQFQNCCFYNNYNHDYNQIKEQDDSNEEIIDIEFDL